MQSDKLSLSLDFKEFDRQVAKVVLSNEASYSMSCNLYTEYILSVELVLV